MKQFRYSAISPEGVRMQGLVEARDLEQAVKVLKDKKLLITGLKDPEKTIEYQLQMSLSHVGGGDLATFTRQFATMVSAGLPMVGALQILRERSKPSISKVIDELIASIEGGESLYKAMSRHTDAFPPLYLALIRVGEVAGLLGEVLIRLANTLDKQREFRAKVITSLLYPGVVSFAMLGVGFFMLFFIMPQMADLYAEFDVELPIYTKIILGVSTTLRDYWYIFGTVVVAMVVGLIVSIKTPTIKDKFDKVILSLPLLGELQHKIISTDVIRTLALLVKSGVSIVDSLKIASEVTNNNLYKKGILSAASSVEKGMSLSTSLSKEQFFPPVVIQMITVGEETGKLDEMLLKLSKQFEKEAISALKALTSAMEPMLIIILGIGVGVMAVSVIFPIYTLTSSVGN